ncbi:putative Ig domain-containing protein [Paludisphaera sp.]|uniref:putative Ig domain-containing protein n=1 Tax=Paludisphaera sp. TaxID=2017432 RepID=UPI00301C644D
MNRHGRAQGSEDFRRPSKRRDRAPKLGAESLERRILLRSRPWLDWAQVEALGGRAGGGSASPAPTRLAGWAGRRGAAGVAEAIQVPGGQGGTTAGTFILEARHAAYRNEVGVFVVDDASGRIGDLQPGDRGYAAAALSRAQVLFHRHQEAGAVARVELPAGAYLGTYLVQNGSSEAFLANSGRGRPGPRGRAPVVFFSFARANADRVVHVRRPGADVLLMEDLWRGGDRDFNDAIVRMSFDAANAAPAASLGLARDTARGGATNDDRITADASLVGSVSDPDGDAIRALRLRLDGDVSSVDVTWALRGGGFALDQSALEAALGRPIPDGPRVLHVQAEDARGASSPWVELAFTLDTTPPPLTLMLDPAFDSAPVGDGETHREAVRLIGRTEPGLPVALGTTGRTTLADATGAFAFDDVPLAAIGANSFVATTDDVAGNASETRLDVTRGDCGFDSLAGWTIDAGGGDGSVSLEGRRIVLREGTSFQVRASRSFVVPATPTTIEFRYEDLDFDASDPSFINDAFEVAILGDNGRAVVPTFVSGRDAFYNVTEGLDPALGSGVVRAGTTVTLDVSGLIPGSIATLEFRLVNNDDDSRTSVAIACLDVDWEAAAAGAGLLAPTSATATPPRSAAGAGARASGRATAGAFATKALDAGPPPQTELGDSMLGPDGSVTFTTSEDFLLGDLFNLDAVEVQGQIQLLPGGETVTYPFIWVSNSAEGTVSRFDTRTGQEVGRYRTGGTGNDPSRVAVTGSGDAWVANRGGAGTVVKILLDGFIDRNGNGVVDTSRDLDGDGRITGQEILPWDANGDGQPDDERIAMVLTIGGGPRGLAIDANDKLWVSSYSGAREFVVFDNETGVREAVVPTGYGSYGAVIDANGQLWSATSGGGSTLVHIDTNTRSFVETVQVASAYGITVDNDGIVWTSPWSGGVLSRYDPATRELTTYNIPATSGGGITVDRQGNVWFGTANSNRVWKFVFDSDRKTLLRSEFVTVGVNPKSASIDADGYLWTVALGSNAAYKIDTVTNTVVDGWPVPTGAGPYNYSDMTGAVRLTVTGRSGTWTEVVDGGRAGVPWAGVAFDADAPEFTTANLRVRASDDRDRLASRPWIEVDSGAALAGVSGRYLEVQARLGSSSPAANAAIREVTARSVPLPTVEVLAPADRARLAAGGAIVISGIAGAGRPILADGSRYPNAITLVTVNGKPVDALDAAGRFFLRADVLPGDNVYTIVAHDLHGQTMTTTLTVEGTQAGGVDFSLLSDVSASFGVDYARTSYRRGEATLHADVAVKNVGRYAVTTPLYVAIANLSDPTVAPLDADGHTPDGLPYYDVSALVAGGRLEAGRTADPFTFSFLNPGAIQFDYDLRFFGLLNRAPVVTTVPAIEALVGRSYRHDVDASDPDGDPVSFRLVIAPVGMTIDPATGVIGWTPAESDLGTHGVVVRADDGRGGWTEQAFDVVAIVPPPNRPPVFASLPRTDATIGARYEYAAAALDPDFDALTFSLVAGPAGMTVHPATGVVSWTPRAGQQAEVVLRVRDGRGGEADQSFTLCVLQAPGNHAPVIVSRPVVSLTGANPWSYSYLVQAVDPDGDTLAYSLSQSPAGMTIDPRSGAIAWSPSAGDLGASIPVLVRVEDGRGGSDEQGFTIEVVQGSGEIHGAKWDDRDGNGVRNGRNLVTNFDFEMGYTGFRTDLVEATTLGPPGVFAIGQDPSHFHGAWGSFRDHTSGTGLMMIINGQTASRGIVWEQDFSVQARTDYTFSLWAASSNPDSPARLQFYVNGQMIGEDLELSSEVGRWRNLRATWSSDEDEIATITIRNYVDAYGGNDFVLDDISFATTGVSESGLADWTIFLDQNQNSRLDPGEMTTVTDANGEYTFTGLTPGTYYVRELEQLGWSQTYPVSPRSHVVTITDDQVVSGIDFGNRQTGDVSNNNPAFIDPPPVEIATAGTLYRFDIAASDPDGDPLSFDLPAAPAGMTVHPTLGVVVWTPTADQVGEHPVVLRVRDDRGGVAIRSFTVTVSAANTAPVVGSTPPGPATAGLPYRYAIAAQDAEGEATTFAFDGQPPAGMTLSADGVLEWPSAGAAGDYPVVVVVTDARGAWSRHAFTLKVAPAGSPNAAPSARVDARTTAQAGRPYVALVRASDPDGDPLSYALIGQPEGMTIDAAGVITWTPAAAQVGGFDVEVKVSDGRPGGEVIRAFRVDVTTQGVNSPPRVTSLPRLAATVGTTYATTLRGSDPDGDPVSFRLVSAPRGMSLDPDTGAIRWIPAGDQLGPHEVVVEAVDPFLAASPQRFVVVVACANQGPTITSRPPTEAWPGDPYLYAVRADDPEGDPLAFELLAGPSGMTIDAASGVVRWTPAADQAGRSFAVLIRVDDGLGIPAVQSFTVATATTPRNRPPVFESRPGAFVVVGETYSYVARAIDPEGLPTRFERGSYFPAGMTIDPATGAVSWRTSAADLGSHVVTIVAVDAGGARAAQSFLLEVRENRAPTLGAAADPGPATAGTVFRHDVRATDPDGDALAYVLLAGPAGMTVDGLGRIAWTIPVAARGEFPVKVAARDPRGAEVVRSFVLSVRPDVDAPRVVVFATPDSVNPGTRVAVRVVATDDARVESLSLTVGGRPVALGADGAASLVMDAVGAFDVVATAVDPSGNVGRAATTIVVVDPSAANGPSTGTNPPPNPGGADPSDRRAPTVVITSPAFEASVSGRTPIIGTVDDPEDRLWYYRVLYARVDAVDLTRVDLSDPDWTLLRQATGEVHGGELAVLDPTHLPRDPHAVVVAAYDRNGQGYVAGVTVNVEGGLLLGNYQFETTDLQVPLAGIPITVTRSYDTLNAGREGDFGHGWSLGVQDARILETIPAGQDYVAGRTKVYLTSPDGRRIGFTYQERLVGASFFGGVVEPYFVPDPGVYETLAVPEGRIGRGGIVGALSGPFNPDIFILTSKDGMKYTYDQSAGLRRIDDLNGNHVTFSDQGIRHSSGARVEFARDHRGRVSSIVQFGIDGARTGGVIRYEYDAAGDLRAVTDQEGLATRYEYRASPRHYLDRAIDARGVTVLRVEYEPIPETPGALRYVALRDALGNVVGRNDYSGLDARTAVVRDANGNETTLVYDDRGNVLRQTDPLGNVTVRSYGDARNPDLETRIVDARGYIVDRDYDARGNLARIVERGTAAAPFATPVVTTFAHDDRNNLRSTTNALGQTTTFAYDSRNNLLTIVNAVGDASRFTYDGLGRKKTFTDFNGNTSLFEYASEDCGCVNPRKITHADGTYQTYAYNQFGQATEEASYEADGTLVEITTTTYDAVGRVIQEVRGIGAGRIVTRKVYDGNLLDYEMVVNPASPNETPATPVSERRGRITDYDYDANGRLIRQVNPDGGVIEFRYDAQGNRVLLRDPVGNVTTWTYDASNRVVEERDPFYWASRGLTNLDAIVAANRLPSGADLAANRGAAHVTARGYDAMGNVVEIIDRNGRRREFSHDHAGRTTEERWHDAGTDALVRSMTWRYDTLGNLLEAGDPDSHYTYTYDTLNRVTAVDNAGTPGAPRVVLTHAYDRQGNVVSTSDNSGVTVSSEYDARNRLSVRKWHDAAIPAGETADVDPIRVDFRYNAASRQTLLERFSGLGRSTPAGKTVTTYETTGQVDKLTHLDAVDAILAAYDYDYDFGGLVVGEARGHRDPRHNQTITYAYDLSGQLINADFDTQPDERFVYDLNGNRVRSKNGAATTAYTTGTANQLTSDGTHRYEYDGEGNLVRKTVIATGATTVYRYDHRNRLTDVEEGSVPGGTQGAHVSYRHDALDRRIRTVTRPGGGGQVAPSTIWTTYDAGRIHADHDGTGATTSRFFQAGSAADGPAAVWDASEGLIHYLKDRLGTVRGVTDASASPIDVIGYAAFGRVISAVDAAGSDRTRFTGRVLDDSTGLQHHSSRYYDAALGRWTQRDPIGFGGGDVNLYRYVANSPMNGTDPTGRSVMVESIGQIMTMLDSPALAAAGFAHGFSVGTFRFMAHFLSTGSQAAAMDLLMRDLSHLLDFEWALSAVDASLSFIPVVEQIQPLGVIGTYIGGYNPIERAQEALIQIVSEAMQVEARNAIGILKGIHAAPPPGPVIGDGLSDFVESFGGLINGIRFFIRMFT